MVYFITDNQYIKIGYTNNTIEERITSLQTGNPEILKLLFVIESASIEDEKLLHNYFNEFKINNEWFDLSKINLTKDYIEKIISNPNFRSINVTSDNTLILSNEGMRFIKLNYNSNNFKKIYNIIEYIDSKNHILVKGKYATENDLIKILEFEDLNIRYFKSLIKKLIEDNIITKTTVGKQKIYILNPFFCRKTKKVDKFVVSLFKDFSKPRVQHDKLSKVEYLLSKFDKVINKKYLLELLASELDCSIRTVQRTIKKAIELNEIYIKGDMIYKIK